MEESVNLLVRRRCQEDSLSELLQYIGNMPGNSLTSKGWYAMILGYAALRGYKAA